MVKAQAQTDAFLGPLIESGELVINFRHVIPVPMLKAGTTLIPDFMHLPTGTWLDITTDGAWAAHLNKYLSELGQGIHITTNL